MACSSATAQPTGSVAGGATSGENDGLERCDKTLGVLRIEEAPDRAGTVTTIPRLDYIRRVAHVLI